MADEPTAAWPRPYFKATEQQTQIFFVCFARSPLVDVQLSRSRFGLPSAELLERVEVREHRRDAHREWFENWWADSFGTIARHDLGEQLPALTASELCVTLALDLPDQADLAPQQTIWGLSRWLCARGAGVVTDVHALRFRTRAEVEALRFESSDVQRDVKLVFETTPTQGPLHLMHTRGLCKFARPELMSFVLPGDVDVMSKLLNQVARTLMEGAAAAQIRLRVVDGVELVTTPFPDAPFVETLGLGSAVLLGRADGISLAGIERLVPPT